MIDFASPSPLAGREGWRRPRCSTSLDHRADGIDYLDLGLSAEPDLARAGPGLQALLENVEGSMTRQAILRSWPESAAPSGQTLWQWLGRVVKEGRVLQQGCGSRKEPYRYCLPGMVEKGQAQSVAEFTRRLELQTPAPPPWVEESKKRDAAPFRVVASMLGWSCTLTSSITKPGCGRTWNSATPLKPG